MLYFLAIVCPPLAVLCCGRFFSFLVNLLLWVCLWIPGSIHAFAVVNETKANRRQDRLVKALKG